MLNESNISAHAAVKDLNKARRFYEDILRLEVVREDEEGICYRSGNTNIYIYESEFANTNRATGASWAVDDIEKAVESLKAKGVVFEHYDLPGGREGDIHLLSKHKIAWFTDPDGNIFAIMQETSV